MPGKRPKLCLHKATQQYFVFLAGKRHYLGDRHALAKIRYERMLNEWQSSGRRLSFGMTAQATMSVLIAEYVEHSVEYYRRPDGSTGRESEIIALALRPLLRLYGEMSVGDIDAMKIEAARNACIDHRWLAADEVADYDRCKRPRGWCRKTINQNLGRWKRMFKWGFTRKLVPLDVLEQVRAVEGLRIGRSKARESKEVMPVPPATVDATLAHLLAPVRAMVELQRLTGMRPGEVCGLRPGDVDRTGEALRLLLKGTPVDLRGTWAYLPGSHKTAHHGHNRVILLGPKAQAVLAPFLDRDPDAACFSPAEGLATLRAEKRERRQTPVQPSQQNRRKTKPKKTPATSYTPTSYAHAIAQACRRHGIQHWHPHQLRHLASHEIEQNFDYETARQVLGHRHVNTTKLYLRAAIGRASEAMDRAG